MAHDDFDDLHDVMRSLSVVALKIIVELGHREFAHLFASNNHWTRFFRGLTYNSELHLN